MTDQACSRSCRLHAALAGLLFLIPVIESGCSGAVGENRLHPAVLQDFGQICRHHIPNGAVAGSFDITLADHIPDCDMMFQQQLFLFFNGLRNRFFCQSSCDLPEPVLRMPVKKLVFPGFHRWKGTEYQHPAFCIVNRCKLMYQPFRLHDPFSFSLYTL